MLWVVIDLGPKLWSKECFIGRGCFFISNQIMNDMWDYTDIRSCT